MSKSISATVRIAAMTLMLATSAFVGSAFADNEDQNAVTTYGSVEGFGGFAGRVGNKIPYSNNTQSNTATANATGIGSVEGFGGFAGRVGNPVSPAVAGANEGQATH
jgi:hypothetical protein